MKITNHNVNHLLRFHKIQELHYQKYMIERVRIDDVEKEVAEAFNISERRVREIRYKRLPSKEALYAFKKQRDRQSVIPFSA